MRHLHFTQSLEPLYGGGLGTSALALHSEMRAQGVSSVLCATRAGTPQCQRDGTFEFSRVKPRPLYFSPEMKQRAPELVRGADVLHGHGMYVGPNYIFGRAARRELKPLVYHVHGMFEPYILKRSRWKKRLVHWLFENNNFHDVRLWRALTAKEAGQIRARGLQPVVIAPNGLNLADFPRPQNILTPIRTPFVYELRKNRSRLLFLGRIHPKKGLDILLQAWARLDAETADWELIIAGPDENGHLPEMRRLAQSLAIQDRVFFTGAVTGESKTALLHSADLFVLPSYSEGFSMSLLEAMACEVPVIATDSCNFPEISTAFAGWECHATLDSLVTTLQTALAAGPAERKQRGQNAQRLVAAKFTWQTIIKVISDACAAHC
ncbi:MAG TPA: glycosyltransferase [Verrucomicrobiae bacterium]|jgi:glycosyltransferase involved in cell wall biosynthesis|nr:glycosyltransferase [Verrucomicrobiae bacterium]